MERDTKDLIAAQRQSFFKDHIAPLEDAVAACESPIEQLMLWALINNAFTWGSSGYTSCDFLPAHGCWPGADNGSDGFWCVSLGDEMTIGPQLPVTVNGKDYRIDIGLSRAVGHGSERVDIHLAIECDGHDFHERTKEQAQRDKERDRDLQSIGWHIARFTGSEIYWDADNAATAAFRLMSNLVTIGFDKIAAMQGAK